MIILRKFSGILCAVMLMAFMLPMFSVGSSAASMPSVKGDVNRDGYVAFSDAKMVADICAGTVAYPSSGSEVFTNANIAGSDIDMEDARRIARVSRGIATFESLYGSSAAANTALVAYYNAIVNQVKTSDFKSTNKVIAISHDSSSTVTDNVEMGYISTVTGNYVKVPDSLIDSFMGEMNDAVKSETYTAPSTVSITNANFPILDTGSVSSLSASDIKSISVSVWNPVDVLSTMPATYKAGSKNCDITTYINRAAALSRCMKITVVLKQETDKSIASLGSAISVREKAYDSSFRYLVSSYPVVTREPMDMTMSCNSAKSDLTITYYINSNTLKPMAASYVSELYFDQDASMSGDLGIEGFGKISGSMTVKMTNSIDEFFLFTEAFL